jgi:putative hydrolase of the HAD superfamily
MLIKPIRRVGESYAVLAKQFGVEISTAELAERFRVCFDSAPLLAFPGASAAHIEDLECRWWKELVRRIFEPRNRFQRFDDYFAELFAYFGRPEAWALYSEVADTLSALKERGLILDVISNFDSRLIGILEGLGIAQRFEHVFISSRIGHAKPARQIFLAALERHGLEPAEVLHVGDSEKHDFHGATNAGLRAVLLERNGKGESSLTPRITSLESLFPLLL